MKRLVQPTIQLTFSLAALITASLLGACSSGGSSVVNDAMANSQPQTETGTFLPGPIEGLQYESTSHTGVTNARGEFQFVPGETVTFSVGGIVLGAAPGAKQITPFDFFGMSPPDTELAIRNYLESEAVTDFDRASNITFFLLLLDKDGDPANGLDVGEWNQTLARASLSFDEHVFLFYETDEFSDLRAATGPWYEINASAALPSLYEQLSITVPAHALSELVTDFGEDGSVERRDVYDYDALGFKLAFSIDVGDTGNFDTVLEYSYDPRGRLVSQERHEDTDADGATDDLYTSTTSYDDFGRVVETRSETDEHADGVPESTVITTNQWSEQGHRIYRESRSSTDWVKSRWSYDENGRVTQLSQHFGAVGTETPASVREETYTYDPDTGLLLAREDKTDSDNDGSFEGTQAYIYRYDTEGREVENVFTDSHDTWTSSKITTTTRSYDDAGNIVEQRVSIDNNDDGNPDSTRVHTYTYNYSQSSSGRLVSYRYSDDSDGDDVIDEQELREITYDDKGRAEKVISHLDNDSDSDFDVVRTDTFEFDDNGRVVEQLREELAEGVLSGRSMVERNYDQHGNLLMERGREDTDLDGIWDLSNIKKYSYELLDDGLFHLLSSWH
ncbi:hypothetical protein ACXYTJ_10215 [Gilvimarinus sp. F26214L]|uniref:hypothetical protein n=1 Tax=Gilvimarinus sp. DZF01 TaxID=3461371 RepID=UPI004045CB07